MISDNLSDYDLILASASPRRRQLMEEAGFRFRPAVTGFEEMWPEELQGKEIAEFLAGGKADSWSEPLAARKVLITADTIVWCHGTNLGKPKDDDEAIRFLKTSTFCCRFSS